MSNWNDGGLPWGSRKIRLYAPSGCDASGSSQWTTDKGIFTCESFQPNRNQNVVRRYDEKRKPSGALGLEDFIDGTLVVQLAYEGTDPVDPGFAFTSKRRGTTATAESWVVTGADEPEGQGDTRKQTLRIQRLEASPSGNVPAVYP